MIFDAYACHEIEDCHDEMVGWERQEGECARIIIPTSLAEN